MRRFLLTFLIAIITIAANAQFKGSVDIKHKMEPQPHVISFNFARVCQQLEVDKDEFGLLLRKQWYGNNNVKRDYGLYLLTDGGGETDSYYILTADGKKAGSPSEGLWRCEMTCEFITSNRFDFYVCPRTDGSVDEYPLGEVGDTYNAVFALEYQGKIATFDITMNLTEEEGPAIPLSSLEKVGEKVLSGCIDYSVGDKIEFDLTGVASLFGDDVEGGNLQIYGMKDAEQQLITGDNTSLCITIDGMRCMRWDWRKTNFYMVGYEGYIKESLTVGADPSLFPSGQKTSGSVFLVADGKYYELILDIQFGRKEDDDTTLMGYRPFLEEGKIWMLGYYGSEEELTAGSAARIEYLYLEGDTLVGGITCKKWMQTVEKGDAGQSTYMGAAYERGGKVYAAWPGTTDFCLLYDFTSPMGYQGQVFDYSGQQITPYTMGSIVYISDECYKGFAREVSLGNGYAFTKWKYGVGYCGLYNTIRPDEGSGLWRLMACAVGDEVLYYDASLMDWDNSAEAKKKKLDFTHVIKAQPRAPRRRAASADQDGLSGEYSDAEVFVRLNNLEGNYTATLTDASGQVVYQKTMLTDNVLALNTTLTAYGPGSYVLTLENDNEAFTATLNIEPYGIRSTPSPSLSRGAIYDLQGRRLMKVPEKGLYIQDGKKVIK